MLRNLCILALVPAVAAAAEANPRAAGFTMEVGAGIGYTTASAERKVGVAMPSLSLGAFVTPRLALMARAGGTGFLDDGSWTTNGFYGVAAQYWPNPGVFFGAGAGLGLYGRAAAGSPLRMGLGLTARVGLPLLAGDRHALVLGVDTFSGYYRDTIHFGAATIVEWQMF